MGLFGIGNKSADFKVKVDETASKGKLSEADFNALKKDYDALGGLEKYAVSSWLSGHYPELDQSIRGAGSEGWVKYQSLTGND